MLQLHYSYMSLVARNKAILPFLVLVLALFYRNMFECFLFTFGELHYEETFSTLVAQVYYHCLGQPAHRCLEGRL